MKKEKTYIGRNKEIETYIIKAAEGKVLQRKSDGQLFGSERTLGYEWYIGGEKLSEPHFEVPSDYTEVDEPVDEEEISEESE